MTSNSGSIPDNPYDFTVIRACPPLTDDVRAALIEEFERMEAEGREPPDS